MQNKVYLRRGSFQHTKRTGRIRRTLPDNAEEPARATSLRALRRPSQSGTHRDSCKAKTSPEDAERPARRIPRGPSSLALRRVPRRRAWPHAADMPDAGRPAEAAGGDRKGRAAGARGRGIPLNAERPAGRTLRGPSSRAMRGHPALRAPQDAPAKIALGPEREKARKGYRPAGPAARHARGPPRSRSPSGSGRRAALHPAGARGRRGRTSRPRIGSAP